MQGFLCDGHFGRLVWHATMSSGRSQDPGGGGTWVGVPGRGYLGGGTWARTCAYLPRTCAYLGAYLWARTWAIHLTVDGAYLGHPSYGRSLNSILENITGNGNRTRRRILLPGITWIRTSTSLKDRITQRNFPVDLNQQRILSNRNGRRTQVTRARAIHRFDSRFALEGSLLEQVTPVSPRHV